MNKIEFNKNQSRVDSERVDCKKSLIGEERSKHVAVEQALALLAKEDIYAYIYADIPHPEYLPGIPCVYQFNTIGCLCKYDEKGNPAQETSYRNSFFHAALWKSLVDNHIQFSEESIARGIDKLDPRDPDTHTKRMYFMMYFLTSCYRQYQEKVNEIIDNPI
jgi:hypothetical protein